METEQSCELLRVLIESGVRKETCPYIAGCLGKTCLLPEASDLVRALSGKPDVDNDHHTFGSPTFTTN